MIATIRDALMGIDRGRERRAAIAKNLGVVDAFECWSARIFTSPSGRLFELGDGTLMTIDNEQPRGTDMLHLQNVRWVSREDAEDYYGWTPRPDDD